jgi:hypothetical protein
VLNIPQIQLMGECVLVLRNVCLNTFVVGVLLRWVNCFAMAKRDETCKVLVLFSQFKGFLRESSTPCVMITSAVFREKMDNERTQGFQHRRP